MKSFKIFVIIITAFLCVAQISAQYRHIERFKIEDHDLRITLSEGAAMVESKEITLKKEFSYNGNVDQFDKNKITIEIPSSVYKYGLTYDVIIEKVNLIVLNEPRTLAVGDIKVSFGGKNHTIKPGNTVDFYAGKDKVLVYSVKGIATGAYIFGTIPYTVCIYRLKTIPKFS